METRKCPEIPYEARDHQDVGTRVYTSEGETAFS
jgi:hypothetical protein